MQRITSGRGIKHQMCVLALSFQIALVSIWVAVCDIIDKAKASFSVSLYRNICSR